MRRPHISAQTYGDCSHDDVAQGVVDAQGNAWFATAAGVGSIQKRTMTFAAKAEFYEQEIERYKKVLPPPNGSSASCQRAEMVAALTRLKAVAATSTPVARSWRSGWRSYIGAIGNLVGTDTADWYVQFVG